MKIRLILMFLLSILLSGCVKELESVYDYTPTERIQKELSNLRNELTSANWGWKMVYFPKINKELFSNVDTNLKTYREAMMYIDKFFGYGGYTFWIKFNENGSVTMISDYSSKDMNDASVSLYELKYSSGITLSFISRTKIHDISDINFEGISDFVLSGRGESGDIILKSMKFLESDREFIILQKLDSLEQWKSEPKELEKIKTQFEKNIKSPIIVIKDNKDSIVFKSNYSKYLNIKQRYVLFAKDHTHGALYSPYITGLGSGYSFTHNGIFFNQGINYKGVLFQFFEIQKDGTFMSKSSDYTAKITEKK